MPRRAASLIVLGFVLCTGPAAADDPWELSADGTGDDDFVTNNLLRHAVVQHRHDLQGAPPSPDQDWMRLVTKPRHSYEAHVSGNAWDAGCIAGPGVCPRFDRVSQTGTVLTAGVASNEDVPAPGTAGLALGRTVRWIATTGTQDYLRAVGHQSSPQVATPYDVVYYDTTLFVPRWNNTATQTTVLILQNTTSITVTGTAYFHDASGALLTSVAVNVPRNGVQVIQTASIQPLVGQSGSVTIAQMGGYAALMGKAVALEAATGFTFDTPIVHVPR